MIVDELQEPLPNSINQLLMEFDSIDVVRLTAHIKEITIALFYSKSLGIAPSPPQRVQRVVL